MLAVFHLFPRSRDLEIIVPKKSAMSHILTERALRVSPSSHIYSGVPGLKKSAQDTRTISVRANIRRDARRARRARSN